MKRREFITLLGGAAATLSLGAHAQQGGAPALIGALMNISENDPRAPAFIGGISTAAPGTGLDRWAKRPDCDTVGRGRRALPGVCR